MHRTLFILAILGTTAACSVQSRTVESRPTATVSTAPAASTTYVTPSASTTTVTTPAAPATATTVYTR